MQKVQQQIESVSQGVNPAQEDQPRLEQFLGSLLYVETKNRIGEDTGVTHTP